ncbi:MAG: hypothetical protein RR015_00090, partial [Bacteroidales bacterium]
TAGKEAILTRTLFPLAGIAALVTIILNLHFTAMRSDSGLENAIRMAAVTFIQFFASYYITAYIAVKIFGKHVKNSLCEIYVSYLTSVTIIFYIAESVFPDYTTYIAALSLYVVYIAWIGGRYYLNIDDNSVNNRFVASISIMVLILPAIIAIILRIILPK